MPDSPFAGITEVEGDVLGVCSRVGVWLGHLHTHPEVLPGRAKGRGARLSSNSEAYFSKGTICKPLAVPAAETDAGHGASEVTRPPTHILSTWTDVVQIPKNLHTQTQLLPPFTP